MVHGRVSMIFCFHCNLSWNFSVCNYSMKTVGWNGCLKSLGNICQNLEIDKNSTSTNCEWDNNGIFEVLTPLIKPSFVSLTTVYKGIPWEWWKGIGREGDFYWVPLKALKNSEGPPLMRTTKEVEEKQGYTQLIHWAEKPILSRTSWRKSHLTLL